MVRMIVCLLMSTILLIPGTRPAPATIPASYSPVGPGDSYLALGDSLATGFEVANDGQPGYPAVLLETLHTISPTLTLENLGRNGETTTSMITSTGSISSQLDLALQFIQQERAAGRRVGLVTLGIGGNDALSMYPQPFGSGADGEAVLDVFEANFNFIVAHLLEALTVDGVREGDLLIINYYNAYPNKPSLPDGEKLADIWTPRFNAVISDTATAYNIPLANVAQAFAGNEAAFTYVQPACNLMNPIVFLCDYHPRPAGHAAIAEQLFAASGYTIPPPEPTPTRLYLPLLGRPSGALFDR